MTQVPQFDLIYHLFRYADVISIAIKTKGTDSLGTHDGSLNPSDPPTFLAGLNFFRVKRRSNLYGLEAAQFDELADQERVVQN